MMLKMIPIKTVFIIWAFLGVLKNIDGRPSVDSGTDPLGICYSLNCPEGTTMCGKLSEISEDDKTKLSVQIRCYDSEGAVLKSKNLTEDNPFAPNVYYKGTRFSAVVKLLPSDGTENNPQGLDNGKEFNFIGKPSTGPKSEVEDLLSK